MDNTVLGDWSSVIQLLCAYTLLMKGYVQYKERAETDTENMLAEAELQLTELQKREPQPKSVKLPKVTQFEFYEWSVSHAELNRHRKFMTEWYWRRKEAVQKADRRRNIVLLLIGTVAFCLLLCSSAFAQFPVHPVYGLVLALALWIPVFAVMITTWMENAALLSLISYSNEPKGPRTPSDKPWPGKIYVTCNEIRRRYMHYRNSQWLSVEEHKRSA